MSRNERLVLKKGAAVITRAPLDLTEDMQVKAREILLDAARAILAEGTSRGRK